MNDSDQASQNSFGELSKIRCAILGCPSMDCSILGFIRVPLFWEITTSPALIGIRHLGATNQGPGSTIEEGSDEV